MSSVVVPEADVSHLAVRATVVPDMPPAGSSDAEDADAADTVPDGGGTTPVVLKADDAEMPFHWSTKDFLLPTLLLSSVKILGLSAMLPTTLLSSPATCHDPSARSASKVTFLSFARKEVPTVDARKGVATDVGDDGDEIPPPLAEDDARLCLVDNSRRELTPSFNISYDGTGFSTCSIRARPVGLRCEWTSTSFETVHEANE